MSKQLQGIITALVTPFHNGRVDYTSLKKLVVSQLDAGVDGLVVNGTTAESPTLTADEVEKIFKTVKALVSKQVPIILGAGDNSTARTVEKVKKWGRWSPDAFLLVTPYYNRPTQEGLYQHFQACADVAKKPIVLYNVPTRTAVNMQIETIERLAKHKNIISIKEASGNMELASQMSERLPKNFILLSGDDSSCMDFCNRGGRGVVSVISHIIPKEMKEICKRSSSGDLSAVGMWTSEYFELNKLMGIEPNPTPVKQALKEMGIIRSSEMRLPLVKMTTPSRDQLKAEMKRKGLL